MDLSQFDVNTQARIETIVWSVGTVLFILMGSIVVGWLASQFGRLRGWSDGERRKAFWGFAFAGPWILGFLIFVVGPGLASLTYSFTDYKLGETASWIGLENYRQLIMGEGAHGRRFAQAMYNSFYYAAVGVPLQVLAALLMAMLLNQNLRGVKFFRLVFYLPVILAGGPAILLAWRYMLASNGGFINNTLQSLASRFFLFDWLYRGFIYAVESFNGFYAGVVRGDALGPLTYAIPLVIGALLLISLAWGEWSPRKQGRAVQAAEILALLVSLLLFARGLVAQPLEPALLYGAGAAVALGVFAAQDDPQRRRGWEMGGLLACGAGIVLVLVAGSVADRLLYLPPLVLAALPLAVSRFGQGSLTSRRLLVALGGLLLGIMLSRLIPGQLDGGRANLLFQYLTFQTGITDASTTDALEAFASTHFSSLWLYAAVAVIAALAAGLDSRYARARRSLLIGSAAVLSLLAVGSILDSVRFFQAFESVAAADGSPNFHFTLFRTSLASFPDNTRAPMWLASELWSKPSMILINMWSSGAGMLIFLAALKSVPQSLYEAAEVDGATRWQKFTNVTLPMISPAMFYNIVIGIIAALQTFEAVFIISNTTTQDSLASAAFFLFIRTFRQLAIGQGAAVSWILAVIIIVITVLQFRYSKWVNYEA